MSNLLADGRRDVSYAVRTLAKAPAFTAVAIVTLALGIGAVTVIYSLLRNVLLEPFPYPHSERMVDVVVKDASDRVIRGPRFAAPEFLDYAEQTRAFEDVIGTAVEPMHWESETGAEQLMVGWMTPNGFTFLGVRPLLGRVFGTADASPGAPPVAVMNYRTWVRLFAADSRVVGRSLIVNGEPRTIIGVMPPRFEWNVADLWVPAIVRRTDDPTRARNVLAFQARLRPGVTINEAEAELRVIAARRAAERPQEYPPHSRVQVITVIDWVVGRFRGVLYTLFAAVSLLLVIACCNVANMLLARATAREREITIRGALGASRGRIVRQLLAESAILASGGALAGAVLAYGGVGALAHVMPRQGIPWETELRVNLPVLAFALVTAAFATFAFGLFPALHGSRRELVAAANSTGRSGTADRRQSRMRGGLVIAEVALSIVLLLGAGLLMRSFLRLVTTDLGFNPKGLLLLRIAFPEDHAGAPVARTAVFREAIDQLHTIPGVESVTVSNSFIGGMNTTLELPGRSLPNAEAQLQFCSEEIADTLGVHVAAGRSMSPLEVKAAHKIAVVSQALVSQYFKGEDPLGRTIRLPRLAGPPASVPDPTFTIVGVVSDVANNGPRQPPAPAAYVPYTVRGGLRFQLLVRTSTEPMALLPAIRNEIQRLDRRIALVQPATAETLLDEGLYAQPRFILIVLGMFAATGLLLVALGVYGVLAYTVSLQRRELAIRVAVGAQRHHILRHVLGMGSRLIGAGMIVGLAVGLATNRLLMNQLWNVSPNDPLTITAVLAIVCLMGTLACWIPARRAVRVAPIGALRND